MADEEKPSSDTTRIGNLPLGRRKLLKVAGTTIGGLAFVGNGAAATSDGTVDIDINYDDYSSPSEIYNVNDVRSGIDPRFVSSPTKEGSQALRLEFGDSQKAGNVEYRFDEHGYGMPSEVYTSFWLYPENFQIPEDATVRIFWLPLTNGDGSSGGGHPDGTNGWSNAIGFSHRNNSPAPDGYNFFTYIYHMDKTSTSGDFAMTDEPVWMDQWNQIEGYVKCNTWDASGANHDGVMRYWVNGNLAFERTDLRFTTSEDNLIEGVGPLGYLYGTSNPDAGLIYDGHRITIGGMPSSDDGSGSDANTLEIVSDGGTDTFEYEFTANGPIEPLTDAETYAAEDNDTVTDNGDGTYTATGKVGNGYGDAFSVDGEVTAFSAGTDSSNYTLYWNGEAVSVDELVQTPPNTFEVVAAEDSGGAFDYEFTADGPVELITDAGSNSAEDNDTVTDNGDGTYTVTGRTGSGYGDAFSVDGEVTAFSATTDSSNYTLYWNGEAVSVDQLIRGEHSFEIVATKGTKVFKYEFTADGPIEPNRDAGKNSAEGNDKVTDNGDGTYTATGKVGNGFGDAFTVTGDVIAFSAGTDDSNYTLFWDGQSVSVDQLIGS